MDFVAMEAEWAACSEEAIRDRGFEVMKRALEEIIAINDEAPGIFRKRGGTRRGLSIEAAKEALKLAEGF